MRPSTKATADHAATRTCLPALMAIAGLLLASAAASAAATGERPNRRLCVTDFGAVGDGATDDSPAFQKALEAVVAAGRGTLIVPPGDYRLARLVSAEVTSSSLAILGDGAGVSNLIGDNASGVLRLHDERCQWHVVVKDIAFLARREGSGTALEVSSPPRGVRNFRTLLVENVEIRGEGLPTRQYFDHGIKAIAQWRPLFLNVVIGGVLDPALKKEQKEEGDDSALCRSTCGIQADFCYAPSFQHCYVWGAQTGYRVVSLGRPQGPEDCAFYRSNAVGCRVGIDVDTPIPEPQLVIESCHINCRDVGVRLSRRKFFQITGNLFYGGDNSEAPYTDILVKDSFAGVISQNIFHSPDRDNLKPPPSSNRTMIHLTGPRARDLVITDNVFNAKGTTLVSDEETTGVILANNRFSNPYATPPGPWGNPEQR